MKRHRIESKTSSTFSNQDAYLRAKKRLDKLKGFYWHLVSYIAVNVFLIGVIAVNYGLENIWNFGTFSTAFFWGIGLGFHAIGVFGKNVLFSRQWEDRKIQEYIDEDKTRWE
ncbi:2TM domain-containing protein [Postechiella marina]|uniref:2TM domain-containing protein n=1 Tax=Postechiella marina TaxID=943941 RepID=A0ABP8CHM9_9FLAO